VPDVIEAVLSTYRDLRQPGEHFIDAVRRIGLTPSRKPRQPATRGSRRRSAGLKP
jgi:sulfite reductase (NADPH) hemoprotein beta-component